MLVQVLKEDINIDPRLLCLGKALRLTSSTENDGAGTPRHTDDKHEVGETVDDDAVTTHSDNMSGVEETAIGSANVSNSGGADLGGQDTVQAVDLDGIFYDTGGRIRDPLVYVRSPALWKKEKKGYD